MGITAHASRIKEFTLHADSIITIEDIPLPRFAYLTLCFYLHSLKYDLPYLLTTPSTPCNMYLQTHSHKKAINLKPKICNKQ